MNSSADHPDPSVVAVVYPPAAVILAFCCCIAFIVVGILGNALTVLALLRHKKLRFAPTTTFIISLCITDLIFCSFNLPITAVRYRYQKWVLGPFLCRLFPFFFYLNVAASLFNMMTITINRYVLIAHYHLYDRLFSKRNIRVMISLCWGIPLVLLLPTLASAWGRFGYKEHTFSCTILRHEGKSPKKALFLIGFLLPCLIIMICYGGIFWIVRKSRNNVSIHSPKAHNGTKDKRASEESTLTRMVIAIYCLFIICYLPLMLANVSDDEESYPWIHIVASILAWSASVWNPFLYAGMNRRYRNAYLKLFAVCGCKRWVSVVGSSGDGTTTNSSQKTAAGDTSVMYSSALNKLQTSMNGKLNQSQEEVGV